MAVMMLSFFLPFGAARTIANTTNTTNSPVGQNNDTHNETCELTVNIMQHPAPKSLVIFFYSIIFFLGMFGNLLVTVVVLLSRNLRQLSTNIFIANLAAANIMVCLFAVPFTPLPFYTAKWYFGSVGCFLMAFIMPWSIFISTYVSLVIAVDRYIQIVYPFRPKMQVWLCWLICAIIWIVSCSVSIPYGLKMDVDDRDPDCPQCVEMWTESEEDTRDRRILSMIVFIMQYIVPGAAITFCYTRVSMILREKARLKRESGMVKNVEREQIEIKRNHRTNKMLILMIAIFMVCWLPLNVHNFVGDYVSEYLYWEGMICIFFLSHIVAMWSTVFIPFLYGWMNDSFRKEFQVVMPCMAKPCIYLEAREKAREQAKKAKRAAAAAAATQKTKSEEQMDGRPEDAEEALLLTQQNNQAIDTSEVCSPVSI